MHNSANSGYDVGLVRHPDATTAKLKSCFGVKRTRRYDIEAGVFAGRRPDFGDVRARMSEAAEMAYAGLVAPLLRAADPTEPWGKRFMAILTGKRVKYRQSLPRWMKGYIKMRRSKVAHAKRFGLKRPV